MIKKFVKPNIYIHLEFFRGISALLVVAGHLRAFLFINYSEISNPSIYEKIFYFLTGFGHEAVMIFFVLSGFLISKSIDSIGKHKNFFSIFMWKRIVRLEVVLVPALVLTFFLDYLGSNLTDSVYYMGELKELYNSGLSHNDSLVAYDFNVFVKNIFFLQTITVPVFGTNGPLWSLAYEFWYYIIAAMLYIIFTDSDRMYTIVAILCLVMLYVFLPSIIIMYGLIWLFGVGVYIVDKNKYMTKIYTSKIYFLIINILFIMALVIARIKILDQYIVDLLIGLIFSLLVLSLLDKGTKHGAYEKFSKFSSDISYTMYLIHFPLIGFIVTYFLENKQYRLLGAEGIYLLLFVITIFYSYIVYYIFERNTLKIKFFLERYRFFKNE